MGVLVHVGCFMGLAFAEPLVEDELEDGSVPMYGQEVYPEVPAPSEAPPLPVEASGEVPGPSFTEPEPLPEPEPAVPELAGPESAPAPAPPMEVVTESRLGPRRWIPYNEGTREQGLAHGRVDAEDIVRLRPTVFPSACAGAVIPVCGCVGAGVVGAVLPIDEPPNNDYLNGSDAYQSGYLKGYRSGIRRQRVAYTLLGGAVGTSVTLVLLFSL